MNRHIDAYGNVWTAGIAASLPAEGKNTMNLNEAKGIANQSRYMITNWDHFPMERAINLCEALEWALAEIERMNFLLYGKANPSGGLTESDITFIEDCLSRPPDVSGTASLADVLRDSAMLAEAEASAALAAAGDADGTGSQMEEE